MDNLNQLVEIPCPLCGSSNAQHVFWTHDYVFEVSDDRFAVKRCKECGAGYLSPRPRADHMRSYYPEEFYWSWEGSDGKLSWPEIVQKRDKQLHAKAKWLQGMPPGKLLDIGAQKGEFLWFMQQQGWDVEGVEMDSSVPNPAQLPIRYGDFLGMDFPSEGYDVITLWAVLEHVYDPTAFIRKASGLLKPGGSLVVLVTNMDSIQARYYQADDYPRHLTLFTRSSIRRLCRNYGLNPEALSTRQDIFGGALNGGVLYLVKRLFGYRSEEALAEWKQLKDTDLFWAKWRGKRSLLVRLISKVDRLITLPLEKILDFLGWGFILTFRAKKN